MYALPSDVHVYRMRTQIVDFDVCKGTTNLAFPAGLLYYSLTRGAPSVGACARILGSVLLAASILKLALEGPATLPHYSARRGFIALGELPNSLMSQRVTMVICSLAS